MDLQREKLLSFEKEKLTDLVIELLNKLNEFEKNEFISKNIDAKLALDNIEEGDGESFLIDVEKFCKECLDGEYYVEDNYEDYWGSYPQDDFEGCEWAEGFKKYLNIAMMYSRNKEYDIAFKAFEILFNCIKKVEDDFEILGTDEPYPYIEVDYEDIFNEYYLSIKNCIPDKTKMIEKALGFWELHRGSGCTEAIINAIEEIDIIEKNIREKIDERDMEWDLQHLYYELLKGFNERYNPEFDKVQLAKSFLKYDVNFYNDVAEEYFEIGCFEDAIDTTNEGLRKVTQCDNLKNIRINCYEKLSEFEKAYNEAFDLFKEKTSYKLYIRTRTFAEKTNNLDEFIRKTINFLKSKRVYYYPNILSYVLSHEGLIKELLEFLNNQKGYEHSDKKYISKALIYRALHNEKLNLDNIKDYINTIQLEKLDGVIDLVELEEDFSNRAYYLESAVDILKEMVKFHIDAANRSRYQRAAYYCSVVKDILYYLGKREEFEEYYKDILSQNKRRPALQDEMKKKME
ncbi:hypothetical protein NNC19_09525 [Clostridium sp. SHJSY1]|uniref:hypothetical protein n=1 Tax=Clostridium sp. SHJSY1 TaxID=2942483 RepID=UPI002875E53C|nr:hypothetical protein [Clostridium sp. SHJSY1]MDS0525916.1 hypothetical protein [Clostridium sp. SHJSY1]